VGGYEAVGGPKAVAQPAAVAAAVPAMTDGVVIPEYQAASFTAAAAAPALPAAPPRFEASAGPQIQAPVTQQFNFNLSGMPDKEFADRVVESIKSKSGALEDVIAKIVANIIARQKRLSYAP
jgi:hypothetical protein